MSRWPYYVTLLLLSRDEAGGGRGDPTLVFYQHPDLLRVSACLKSHRSVRSHLHKLILIPEKTQRLLLKCSTCLRISRTRIILSCFGTSVEKVSLYY